MSAGNEDHVKAAIEKSGSLYFWRLAIKPGRPIAFGQIDQAIFAGLPGNPAAALVTFLMLVRPLLYHLHGGEVRLQRFPVVADFDHKKKAGRREWLRAHLSGKDQGQVTATKFSRDGAGILSSLVETDGLLELPEDQTSVQPGDIVNFLPFSELLYS
jgi:molybdopterin molybdotransferase